LKDKWIRQVGYLGFVLQFGLITLSNVFAGGFIGYLVVRYTCLGKGWMIPFLMLGVISGLFSGVKYLLKEASKDEKRNKNST